MTSTETPMRHPLPALDDAIRFYEQLSPDNLAALARLYHPDARFEDPFNEVHGLAAIERILRHLFDQVDRPRFIVKEVAAEGRTAFVTWDFVFGTGPRARTVPGVTHWQFDGLGRIVDHRDYWDPAQELYAHWPLLGTLMRWLRRRLSATSPCA